MRIDAIAEDHHGRSDPRDIFRERATPDGRNAVYD